MKVIYSHFRKSCKCEASINKLIEIIPNPTSAVLVLIHIAIRHFFFLKKLYLFVHFPL